MAKLILHAGTHKTGTTTIQSVLHDNRAALAARGIWYPPVWEFFPVNPALQSARAHHAVADAIAGFSVEDRERTDAFIGHLRDISADYDRILLSAESFYRQTLALPQGAKQKGKDRQGRIGFMERLADVFHGLDVEILLYFRSVDRFAESLYAEAIAMRKNTQQFEAFRNTRTYRFDYRFQIDLFARFFTLSLRSFEAAARVGLVESFFRDANLGAAFPESEVRLRSSIPNSAVLWMRRAKAEQGIADKAQRRRWLFALQPEARALFGAEAPSSFWGSRDDRDAFIEKYQSCVQEVNFPPVPPEIAPTCTWDDASHIRTEAAFAAWEQENAAWIADREAARVPPFVDSARNPAAV